MSFSDESICDEFTFYKSLMAFFSMLSVSIVNRSYRKPSSFCLHFFTFTKLICELSRLSFVSCYFFSKIFTRESINSNVRQCLSVCIDFIHGIFHRRANISDSFSIIMWNVSVRSFFSYKSNGGGKNGSFFTGNRTNAHTDKCSLENRTFVTTDELTRLSG